VKHLQEPQLVKQIQRCAKASEIASHLNGVLLTMAASQGEEFEEPDFALLVCPCYLGDAVDADVEPVDVDGWVGVFGGTGAWGGVGGGWDVGLKSWLDFFDMYSMSTASYVSTSVSVSTSMSVSTLFLSSSKVRGKGRE
jgi:hypothetical protein